jgi:hypothetical protein
MDRRAAWLAWSLAALSVALLVRGIALSRAASSTAPDLQFGGALWSTGRLPRCWSQSTSAASSYRS